MKLYAGVDLGTGVRGVNSPDPVNAQDAATKAYADTHAGLGTPIGGAYWEKIATNANAANNSYSGGWATGSGMPPTTFITKLYASTKIRVKIYNISAWDSGSLGNVYYGCRVNGGAIQTIARFFFNRVNTRTAFPFGLCEFVPTGYAQVNTTGSMIVVFYVMTDSGVVWNVDTMDSNLSSFAVISEVP